MGGAMETLVRITKRFLKPVVKDRLLHEDALQGYYKKLKA